MLRGQLGFEWDIGDYFIFKVLNFFFDKFINIGMVYYIFFSFKQLLWLCLIQINILGEILCEYNKVRVCSGS